MANIYINSLIKLSHNGLRAKDRERKWVSLHYQQGRLDGACVVYSVIMALLCIGFLSEEDIDIWTNRKPNKKTQKGKLLSWLLDEQGFIRDGYSLYTIAKELRIYCNELNIKNSSKVENITDKIKNYIEENTPVVLRVKNEEFDHAILAIGTEYDETNKLYKIFCLDPGYSKEKSGYWNCFIDVSRKNTNAYPFSYVTDEVNAKVEIKDILVIDWY